MISTFYQRLIVWVAGPIAIVAGFLATLLVTKVHFLGNLGLDQKTLAADITKALVFIVGSGVTYAAHHKYLENAARWWETIAGLHANGAISGSHAQALLQLPSEPPFFNTNARPVGVIASPGDLGKKPPTPTEDDLRLSDPEPEVS